MRWSSDIHGNLEALEAVLADIERREVASIACLGDFVGYGASPNECIDRLRPRIETAVAGNHDLAACGRLKLGYFNPDAAAAARWTDEQLTRREPRLPGGTALLGDVARHACSSTPRPRRPEDWHYVLSPLDADDRDAGVRRGGVPDRPLALSRGRSSGTRGA